MNHILYVYYFAFPSPMAANVVVVKVVEVVVFLVWPAKGEGVASRLLSTPSFFSSLFSPYDYESVSFLSL